MWWGWALVAGVALVYAASSKRLSTSIITGPMVFVALGFLVSDHGLDLVRIELDSDLVKSLFKITLALLLFVEASRMNLKALRGDAGWVGRLLLFVMPLVMILGATSALLLFDGISIWEAAVLGVILAPTDSALGMPVVLNKKVPHRVRRSLVAESGLNDGLALPFAIIFTGAALADLGFEVRGDAVEFIVKQVGIGVLGGAVLGVAAGWLIARAIDVSFISSTWLHLSALAAGLLGYAGTEALEGNGFVAVWVAGLLYGYMLRRVVGDDHVYSEFAEHLTEALIPASFFVFGATMLGVALDVVTIEIVLFGLLSLIIIRPLATAIGFIGAKAEWPTVLFLGWFGPRGIASLIIAAIVIKEAGLASDDAIVSITSIAVVLSVYLHGLSAASGASGYARWATSHPVDVDS